MGVSKNWKKVVVGIKVIVMQKIAEFSFHNNIINSNSLFNIQRVLNNASTLTRLTNKAHKQTGEY